jgi:hypothetical protein
MTEALHIMTNMLHLACKGRFGMADAPRPRSSEEASDRRGAESSTPVGEPSWISLSGQRDALRDIANYFASFGPHHEPMVSAAAYYEARRSYAYGVGWIEDREAPISHAQDGLFQEYLDIQTERKYELPGIVDQLTRQIEDVAAQAGELSVDALLRV